MEKDDYESNIRPQTPPGLVSPIQSPTWSPISPLKDTSPSIPNSNLLSNILQSSGIYNPRNDALAPKPSTSQFWERTTSSVDTSFVLPSSEGQLASPSVGDNRAQAKSRRAPRKSAGAASKASHLIWIEEEGLPNLKQKLENSKLALENTVQEIESLDMQIRAIKIMKSKQEFKKACEQHVEIKLNLSVRRAANRKEIQKVQRALTTMLKTQQALSLEMEKANRVRQSIQNSTLYTPKKKQTVGKPKTSPEKRSAQQAISPVHEIQINWTHRASPAIEVYLNTLNFSGSRTVRSRNVIQNWHLLQPQRSPSNNTNSIVKKITSKNLYKKKKIYNNPTLP